MQALSPKLEWNLANPKWASALNPVLAIPMLSGIQLTGVALASGNNVINHLLSRKQQGWIITDIDNAATIYRSEPLNDKTLTLNSSATATIALWVW